MSLLEISHLTTKFETQQGTVSAVRDVSYHLEEGEVLGIVGESGSGERQSGGLDGEKADAAGRTGL